MLCLNHQKMKGSHDMSFGNNLREIRKQRGNTQEELAERLGVSRQAISKWESDSGYPETEKLIAISRELNISLDYLLNDVSNTEEKQEQKSVVYPPSGRIAITTFDGTNVITCRSVKCSQILAPGKNEPRFILNGIDRVSFWGEHAVLLGWYASEEDVRREIKEITEALGRGEASYTLRYAADVEFKGFLGQPKLKNSGKE